MLFTNKLTAITGDMWEGLGSLNYLNARFNQITALRPGDLANLPKIREALFEENKIRTVSAGLFSPPPRFVELGLYGNPMSCDTSMCWMKEGEKDGWLDMELSGVPSLYCDNLDTYWAWATAADLGCEQSEDPL